ncbi:MAG: preprotein translocase subunit SecE [Clostridia bacterium]|nr:preprotein translocase subunit SecE [Clostridia bacterium]
MSYKMGFFKNVKSEMKKVVWPTKKQILNNTGLVIILVIAIAAIVLSFDMLISVLDKYFWAFVSSKV